MFFFYKTRIKNGFRLWVSCGSGFLSRLTSDSVRVGDSPSQLGWLGETLEFVCCFCRDTREYILVSVSDSHMFHIEGPNGFGSSLGSREPPPPQLRWWWGWIYFLCWYFIDLFGYMFGFGFVLRVRVTCWILGSRKPPPPKLGGGGGKLFDCLFECDVWSWIRMGSELADWVLELLLWFWY